MRKEEIIIDNTPYECRYRYNMNFVVQPSNIILTMRYKHVGLLQAKFSVTGSLLLPSDETTYYCLN